MEIKIRRWQKSDAKALCALLSNKNILNNLRDGIPYPYTESDALEYISAMQNADENKTFAFAVTCDGRVIGSVGAFRGENIHFRTAELGYYLDESFWNKGVMTEAVKQTVKFVFDNTDIIRIYAEPFAYNTGSCRVLEKAGFEFEGVLRANAVKNGRVLDMKLYSILKSGY